MAQTITAKADASGLRIGIVVSRFNNDITQRLLDGALEGLRSHGAAEDWITVVYVPGAFEVPLAAEKMAEAGQYDALVCLGAVIRGETPHFEYVSDAVARGVAEAMLRHRLPIGFGVLTTNDRQQAMARSGYRDANKGYEAALTAVEMVRVLSQLAR
ncbi:MAG TPA: 6,7-dimethyl-8-ribityllumazine synthase [Candidatus Eisenbacteria bacterium]|nr:6,7-dimethyl-8-ribityllumazine synthase [Candidatus Eisenbacteria bacterium]